MYWKVLKNFICFTKTQNLNTKIMTYTVKVLKTYNSDYQNVFMGSNNEWYFLGRKSIYRSFIQSLVENIIKALTTRNRVLVKNTYVHLTLRWTHHFTFDLTFMFQNYTYILGKRRKRRVDFVLDFGRSRILDVFYDYIPRQESNDVVVLVLKIKWTLHNKHTFTVTSLRTL